MKTVMTQNMEDALCLAAKATDKTIYVCSRAAGHEDDHFDPIDGVSWPQTKVVEQQDKQDKQDKQEAA